MNDDQLALLPDVAEASDAPNVSWELDEHTRHVGRQGLAAARQALREATARLAA